ncbi:cellulose biosynthesis cyclic di-GMP-binding regulatory protein BcsB [Dyella sp. C9]|uniref:cellulose biosynthesis cyclic di-GMP-binding regulatory protein BcsB n=1 Tax=Dyella sp. C9 TaxID=2202154 RepID=UPI001E652E64|nr:cellulose biosynthesis cyclic di-GMP-binding regulatory protein BcsB [Dyella sp. C9]
MLNLSQLGVYGPMKLRGLDPTGVMSVDIRNDEVVTAARLTLNYSYSPALIYQLSHLKVYLNGELVATLPMSKDEADQRVTREIDLDPRLFTDFNRISVQMIAHYTLDHCEDPYHSSLWTDISQDSSLTLTTSDVALANNLALLPNPFFDRHDKRPVVVPFVLPVHADAQVMRAAGVVASWLGSLAAWRGERFPVLNAPPADQHAIAFALPNAQPEGVHLPEIKGPTVLVMANPASPPESGRKLLVVAGRDAKELQLAANALALGQAGMSGDSAIVHEVDLGAERKPYDAPNWVPTDRVVPFKELVTDPQQLEVTGFNPPTIRIDMMVPPDLFAWAHYTVPMDVRYRYTAPSSYNDSVLNVGINDQLLRSDRLKPLNKTGDETHLNVPLLSSTDVPSNEKVPLPGLRVAGNNQLQFQFHIDSQKTGLCVSAATDSARASIDPESTIDFSDFVHYAAMPNLTFFARSGFPFSRMADLADTALVIPDQPDAHEAEAALTLLGRLGGWSGLPALRVAVVPVSAVDSVGDRDLLVIGTGTGNDLLAKWGKSLPMLIQRSQTDLTLRDQHSEGWGWGDRLGGDQAQSVPVGRAVLSSNGPIAAFIGFESPLRGGRSVVALSGTSSAQLDSLLDVLEDNGKVPYVRGDLTVVRDKLVTGLRLGDTYYVGHLPWYAWIWVRISRYPVLMALAGILAGLFVALTVFWALSRLASRRIEG